MTAAKQTCWNFIPELDITHFLFIAGLEPAGESFLLNRRKVQNSLSLLVSRVPKRKEVEFRNVVGQEARLVLMGNSLWVITWGEQIYILIAPAQGPSVMDLFLLSPLRTFTEGGSEGVCTAFSASLSILAALVEGLVWHCEQSLGGSQFPCCFNWAPILFTATSFSPIWSFFLAPLLDLQKCHSYLD